MLIAFSAPTFATTPATTTTSSINVSEIATKVLNIAVKLVPESIDLAKAFVTEFTDIKDVNSVISISGNLISEGIASIPQLIEIFTSVTSFTDVLTKLLPKLLKFALEKGIVFANALLKEDYHLPGGAFNLVKGLVSFATTQGKEFAVDVVGIVTGEFGIDNIDDLLPDSTGNLDGILDMLLPSDGQQPAIDPTTILGNVNTSNVIGLISSVMTSGPAQDIINSGTEIIGGIFNSLITPDSNTNQPVLDFIEIPDVEDENEEIPNTDNSNKPDIADQPNSETSYKVVPNLEAVLGKIKDEKLYGNNYHSKNLAYCYAKLLAGKEISEQDLNQGASANTVIPTETVGIPALKAYINNNKPTIVNVDNSTLVCVGYANQGTKLSDFLFINPTTGEKTTLSDNTQLPDAWDAILVLK